LTDKIGKLHDDLALDASDPFSRSLELLISDVHSDLYSGPDLPIGYMSLSLGLQDPRGPPTNCGTHSQWPLHDHLD